MKNNEGVQEYISRVLGVINQLRVYGDPLKDQTVVSKVLRSLPGRFDHIVAAIEEAKNLSTLTLDELNGSLQAHEFRLNRSAKKVEAKTFQVEREASGVKRNDNPAGRSSFRGRG